jgi:uncharacterized membrane protein
MENVYQAPKADLSISNAKPYTQGSLEKGIAGDYEFEMGKTLKEAWERTYGSKGTIWVSLILYAVVVGITGVILQNLLGYKPENPLGSGWVTITAYQLIQNFVSLPLLAGFMMVAIKLVVNAPVKPTEVVMYFRKFLPLLGTMLLMYLLIAIGLLLLVLPGIYLMVAYGMALPLVVEKNLSPWQALEASRKAITHRWFSIFGFYLLLTLILVVSMIPLLIGLVWAVPLAMLAFGIVYRNIFGCEPDTAQTQTQTPD